MPTNLNVTNVNTKRHQSFYPSLLFPGFCVFGIVASALTLNDLWYALFFSDNHEYVIWALHSMATELHAPGPRTVWIGYGASGFAFLALLLGLFWWMLAKEHRRERIEALLCFIFVAFALAMPLLLGDILGGTPAIAFFLCGAIGASWSRKARRAREHQKTAQERKNRGQVDIN
jgi:hypothetical protein